MFLFVVFFLSVYSIAANFNFIVFNEEFIISIILSFFFFSLATILKSFIGSYFTFQTEKVYFFFSYLLKLNINLLNKICYFITLIECRSMLNILEIYHNFIYLSSMLCTLVMKLFLVHLDIILYTLCTCQVCVVNLSHRQISLIWLIIFYYVGLSILNLLIN